VAPKTSSTLLRPDASYILIGGTGGLGRSMAKWMATKGARNIVLVSRRATINERVQALVDSLAPLGVRIIVKACDVSSQESVEALVKEEMKGLPPVRGVIQGAMVLRVSLISSVEYLVTNTTLGHAVREHVSGRLYSRGI
jgi:NAD(P)-dependent dehydrogenase (short-subunit alcohol dehydrogenase family)